MIDKHSFHWPAMPDLMQPFRQRGSKNLMLAMLAGWVFFFLAVHIYIPKLNKIFVPVIGLPLGFYMAVQGSIIVFVIFLFWFARKQRSSE
ncbi:MAG TPA: sodium/substrate symporter small subunit [Xanthobacteraceae bacterium]|nr:sodium/substrate symporter small subunit [Xanthobacteraceae bacterium]